MVLDDGLPTATSHDQAELERRVLHIYTTAYADGFDPQDPDLVLNRKAHAQYLAGGLGELPSGFISLDASRAWIVYWIVHSLELLGQPLPAEPDRTSIIQFLASCQHPEGGFGGGPYQLAHLAPTYAAVAALVTLGSEDALSVVDRPKLHAYLLRMCVPPERGGGMTMNEGGEVDVRGCYCALAACEMLGLDKQAIADACGMVDFIRRCQSHEGGVGGEPWNEAHGGYSFCGLAAAALLGKAHEALDLDRFLRWAVRCQELESCQQHGEALRCGAATLLATVPPPEPLPLPEGGERLPQLYDARALQLWLLKCCQAPPRGGLRDKPGKAADYYHTCYCLSGLSSSQHYSGIVLGGQQNLLAPIDPLCNVTASKLAAARQHFAAQQ
ncbi:hypothetical protein COHA_001811 [Chlorella ohadii]|uniref:Prenyltransferase alpha-alpha toroid domain-containing protein n=1 Tax=Chlorella ohadii TaxID=2649997 RepID=A0AAD5E1R6_9CHLO|nr:hypothetical protein COHA_001811 [Chlorella ohadii]